jgi:ABC-2 type transport system ATP-binding protein
VSVQLSNISKSYDRLLALEKVSFSVNAGELFGVIGPDGAGKTTLFRIIASLLVPDEGTCIVNGHPVVGGYRAIRRTIGYMPGRFSLYMDLTVEENLSFYARVFGTSIREHFDLVREVYSQIEPFRNRLAGKLSGGMKQKLALSCALIHRPQLLILDEPTTGVDAVSRREFWDLLGRIRQEGITILVSTPYMDEAARCDRVAMLHQGKLLDVNTPGEMGDSAFPLYSLRSSRGVYRYLEKIRQMEGCRSAWLFGDAIHVTLTSPEVSAEISREIGRWDDPTMEWKPIAAGIEDRFIELMR